MTWNRYYFDYLPITKHGIGKMRSSQKYKTLAEAKREAKKRYRQKKIIQATFWDRKNSIGHVIVGGMDTKGKMKSRKYS